MVVATRLEELLLLPIDPLAHLMPVEEVEERLLHSLSGAEGDRRVVRREVLRSEEPQHMVMNGGISLAGEIEVGVVGEVDHRKSGRARLIADVEGIVLQEAIGHLHLQLAGEALLAICRGVPQHERGVIPLLGLPDPEVEARGSAVETIGTVIDPQAIGLVIKRKLPLRDPIAVTTDDGAEVLLLRPEVVVEAVVSEDDIHRLAIPIGYQQLDDLAAVVGHQHLHPGTIGEVIEVVGMTAEVAVKLRCVYRDRLSIIVHT